MYTPQGENKLIQSLKFFANIWYDKDLHNIPIMLLFTNEDLLQDKILLRNIGVEDHLPACSSYVLPQKDEVQHEHHQVVKAKCFIRDTFMKVTRSKRKRHSEVFFTSVNDVEGVRSVFKSYSTVYKDIILETVYSLTSPEIS